MAYNSDVDSIALQRFQKKYSESADGCWIWHGVISRGYGQMLYQGRVRQAHRLSYEHHREPVPQGLTLDHRCHSGNADCPGGDSCMHRRCVNPAHLEPVTQRVNNSRSSSPPAQNMRKESCPAGHSYSGDNLYYKAGKRYCRTCRLAAGRRWYEKVDGAAYARQQRRRDRVA